MQVCFRPSLIKFASSNATWTSTPFDTEEYGHQLDEVFKYLPTNLIKDPIEKVLIPLEIVLIKNAMAYYNSEPPSDNASGRISRLKTLDLPVKNRIAKLEPQVRNALLGYILLCDLESIDLKSSIRNFGGHCGGFSCLLGIGLNSIDLADKETKNAFLQAPLTGNSKGLQVLKRQHDELRLQRCIGSKNFNKQIRFIRQQYQQPSSIEARKILSE